MVASQPCKARVKSCSACLSPDRFDTIAALTHNTGRSQLKVTVYVNVCGYTYMYAGLYVVWQTGIADRQAGYTTCSQYCILTIGWV